jgi:hypothetical protein
LRYSSVDTPISLNKIDKISPEFNLSPEEANEQRIELLYANLIEVSKKMDEDRISYYILPQGLKLLH